MKKQHYEMLETKVNAAISDAKAALQNAEPKEETIILDAILSDEPLKVKSPKSIIAEVKRLLVHGSRYSKPELSVVAIFDCDKCAKAVEGFENLKKKTNENIAAFKQEAGAVLNKAKFDDSANAQELAERIDALIEKYDFKK
jgi:outer membrane murein-binding lipoprotein Lpp